MKNQFDSADLLIQKYLIIFPPQDCVIELIFEFSSKDISYEKINIDV